MPEIEQNQDDYFAHQTAIVEEGASIGKGSKIWVNAHIRKGARLGQDCIISKDTFIDSQVVMGARCKIQNSVSIYNGVTLEDEVFVGPSAVFTNDYYPRAIKPNWKIVPTLIKKGAAIGANATIICGVVIETYAMVGAGSVVLRNVPPHALVVGNPARIVGYVCTCGSRLDGEGFCKECNKYITLKKEENND